MGIRPSHLQTPRMLRDAMLEGIDMPQDLHRFCDDLMFLLAGVLIGAAATAVVMWV